MPSFMVTAGLCSQDHVPTVAARMLASDAPDVKLLGFATKIAKLQLGQATPSRASHEVKQKLGGES